MATQQRQSNRIYLGRHHRRLQESLSSGNRLFGFQTWGTEAPSSQDHHKDTNNDQEIPLTSPTESREVPVVGSRARRYLKSRCPVWSFVCSSCIFMITFVGVSSSGKNLSFDKYGWLPMVILLPAIMLLILCYPGKFDCICLCWNRSQMGSVIGSGVRVKKYDIWCVWIPFLILAWLFGLSGLLTDLQLLGTITYEQLIIPLLIVWFVLVVLGVPVYMFCRFRESPRQNRPLNTSTNEPFQNTQTETLHRRRESQGLSNKTTDTDETAVTSTDEEKDEENGRSKGRTQ